MNRVKIIAITLVLLFSVNSARADTFTQKDRELLIELKIRMQEMEKRFKEGFEQVDKRFSDMFTFLWIITGIFVTLTVAVIGFAYWDRRTIVKKAKDDTIMEIEREGRLRDLINAMREVAKNNPEIAKVLKQFNIL